MSTTLPRISTVVDRPIYEAIAMLANKDGMSLLLKARDLLLEALELIEDAGLEAMVELRGKNLLKSIPLAQAKGRVETNSIRQSVLPT